MTDDNIELETLYHEADEAGYWIKEFDISENFHRGVAACGMKVDLQVIADHEGISYEDTLEKILIGDCTQISAPGTGDTRVERVKDALESAKRFHEQGVLPVTKEARANA